jgi:hypothetical protein
VAICQIYVGFIFFSSLAPFDLSPGPPASGAHWPKKTRVGVEVEGGSVLPALRLAARLAAYSGQNQNERRRVPTKCAMCYINPRPPPKTSCAKRDQRAKFHPTQPPMGPVGSWDGLEVVQGVQLGWSQGHLVRWRASPTGASARVTFFPQGTPITAAKTASRACLSLQNKEII